VLVGVTIGFFSIRNGLNPTAKKSAWFFSDEKIIGFFAGRSRIGEKPPTASLTPNAVYLLITIDLCQKENQENCIQVSLSEEIQERKEVIDYQPPNAKRLKTD
jgi:hypothetical protein